MLDNQVVFSPKEALAERMQQSSCDYCSQPITADEAVQNAGVCSLCHCDILGPDTPSFTQRWLETWDVVL